MGTTSSGSMRSSVGFRYSADIFPVIGTLAAIGTTVHMRNMISASLGIPSNGKRDSAPDDQCEEANDI